MRKIMSKTSSAKSGAISIDQATAILGRNDKELMCKTQDVEIVRRRLILQSPNGTLWSVTVSNTGVLSATAV
jgi:hypothetical protein